MTVEPLNLFESVWNKDMKEASVPRNHHLIMFFKVNMAVNPSAIALTLQHSEVDAAVWLHWTKLEKVLNCQDGEDSVMGTLKTSKSGQQMKGFQFKQFFPYYPNEETGEGIAKAHFIAFQQVIN